MSLRLKSATPINLNFSFSGLVIFLGGILMLVRTANISNHLSNPLELGATWESYAFVSCKILLILLNCTVITLFLLIFVQFTR